MGQAPPQWKSPVLPRSGITLGCPWGPSVGFGCVIPQASLKPRLAWALIRPPTPAKFGRGLAVGGKSKSLSRKCEHTWVLKPSANGQSRRLPAPLPFSGVCFPGLPGSLTGLKRMANCQFVKLPGMLKHTQLFRMLWLSSAAEFGITAVFTGRHRNPISKYSDRIYSNVCLKQCVIQLDRFHLDKVQLSTYPEFSPGVLVGR